MSLITYCRFDDQPDKKWSSQGPRQLPVIPVSAVETIHRPVSRRRSGDLLNRCGSDTATRQVSAPALWFADSSPETSPGEVRLP
jgi:hypothetical protein